jgi:hypothetical protein
MNQSSAHNIKRQIRRAVGPGAVDALVEHGARLVILETFVARLNTSVWRRVWWLLTGRVSA